MTALEEVACRAYVDSVTAYAEGELDDDRATAFEQHTLVCRGCSRYLTQVRTIVRLVSGRAEARSTAVTGRTPAAGAVYAYKFLRAGRIGPFSGFAWPDGDWVSTAGPPRTCRRGIHACGVADLSHWLGEELWVVELAKPVLRRRDKLVSPAGRLERRVTGWDEERARAFARSCTARALARAVEALRGAGLAAAAAEVADAPEHGLQAALERAAAGAGPARAACEYAASAAESLADPPFAAAVGAAYADALAAAHAGGADARRDERAGQSAWLRDTLGLAAESRLDAGAL